MMRPRVALKGCWGAVVVLYVGLYGCGGAFRSVTAQRTGEHSLPDGSSVVLVRKNTSDALTGKSAGTLELQHLMKDAHRRYPLDITEADEEEYLLRVDGPRQRAWVIARPSRQVVLSVDLVGQVSWDKPHDQPEWATCE